MEDYTSYGDYLGFRNTKWLNTEIILDYFQSESENGLLKSKKYRDFVENSHLDEEEYLGDLCIDFTKVGPL